MYVPARWPLHCAQAIAAAAPHTAPRARAGAALMLDDARVLEVSAPETMLAGRMLADLGADVVVIEPPAGSPGRRLAPFLDDVPGIERGLTWHALNYNKRGVTLDLSSLDGKALMRDLATKFDIVIEASGSRRTSPLDSIEFAPRTIRCTIAPFVRT